MTTERNVSLLFAINGSSHCPELSIQTATAAAFGGFAPNYPSVVRLWQGFVFMFGCSAISQEIFLLETTPFRTPA